MKNTYWDRQKEQCEVLGETIEGFHVTPSSQPQFYGEYFYKVAITGNCISYDIEKHALITDHIISNYRWNYRTQFTSKNRHLYLDNKSYLVDFLKTFPDDVTEVVGPVSEDHKDILFDWDNKIDKVLKDKPWYNKYNVKIQIYIPYDKQKENMELIKDFMEFVNSHVENKYWFSKSTRWFHNYLYISKEDLTEIQPWINMLYRDLIDKIYTIENI